MTSKEELREQAKKKLESILGRLCETETAADIDCPICIGEILNASELASYFREGWRELDPDQSLPKNPLASSPNLYTKAQEQMLKAGFVKVKEK